MQYFEHWLSHELEIFWTKKKKKYSEQSKYIKKDFLKLHLANFFFNEAFFPPDFVKISHFSVVSQCLTECSFWFLIGFLFHQTPIFYQLFNSYCFFKVFFHFNCFTHFILFLLISYVHTLNVYLFKMLSGYVLTYILI